MPLHEHGGESISIPRPSQEDVPAGEGVCAAIRELPEKYANDVYAVANLERLF